QLPEAQVIQVSTAKAIEVCTALATEISIAHAIEVPTAHAIEVSMAHAIKVSTAQATEVSMAQATKAFTIHAIEVFTASPQTQNTNKARISRLSKLKSYTRTHPYSSVMAPFKPPCLPGSLLLTSYRKHRKPLSAVNNIIIQLPPGASSQSYDLNINLKIN
ncbi:20721_t:CDS:1, partial [Racocetra persica]